MLGSASAMVVVAGAQAADLPTKKAAPAAQYVQICNVNGVAGFTIPGSDTCLKIYGDADWEGVFLNRKAGNGVISTTGTATPPGPTGYGPLGSTSTNDTFVMGGRGELGVTATSNTAYGPLVADFELVGNARTGAAAGIPGLFGSGFGLDHATIKWAGLTAGDVGSFYNLGNGPGDLDFFSPDPGTQPLIAYTASFGGGFAATLSLEDNADRRVNGAVVGFTNATNTYHGQQYPDVVGLLAVTQGWGSAKVAGALHDTNIVTGWSGDSKNTLGWGVDAALTINIPGAGAAFTVQGAYSKAALAYSGVTAPGVLNVGGGTAVLNTDAMNYGVGLWSVPTAWSVAADLKFQITPQFAIAPQISYGQITYNADPIILPKKITSYFGGVTANWDPVKNLDFQLDLMYVSTKQSAPTAGVIPVSATNGPFNGDNNGFYGRLAIKRSF